MSADELLIGLTGLAAVAALPLLIVWFFFAFIGASAASARGRGPGAWFLLALILGPFALLLLALFPVDTDALEAKQVRASLKARCPFCRRAIPMEATRCSHCRGVISPLAHIRRELDVRVAEESQTPRHGIRGITKEKEADDVDVISQAIHLCSGGVPPSQAAAHLGVSEEEVQSWIDRYMDDDVWMHRVDMAAAGKPK